MAKNSLPISMMQFSQHMMLAPNARALAAKMVELAEQSESYRPLFLAWAFGGTIELRAASEPFGNYWRDLKFSNLVDTLDDWHAKLGIAAAK